MSLTTIINYCTNEFRFIHHSISAALQISDRVIVPVCTHFFSGTPENKDLLTRTYYENPDALFIEFPFNPSIASQTSPHFWHNIARWIALQYVSSTTDFVLFLDADEVVDADAFQRALASLDLDRYTSLKWMCYWYFRSSQYQANQFEDNVVMTRRSALKAPHVFSDSERHALALPDCCFNVLTPDDTPAIHHYSWVRTKEEMLAKVMNWGHAKDRDWKSLVEKEFESTFNGVDFVHGYTFNTVDPFVAIDLTPIESSSISIDPLSLNNVISISHSEFENLSNDRSLWRRITKFI